MAAAPKTVAISMRGRNHDGSIADYIVPTSATLAVIILACGAGTALRYINAPTG
jgi:hypothetical protein